MGALTVSEENNLMDETIRGVKAGMNTEAYMEDVELVKNFWQELFKALSKEGTRAWRSTSRIVKRCKKYREIKGKLTPWTRDHR